MDIKFRVLKFHESLFARFFFCNREQRENKNRQITEYQ